MAQICVGVFPHDVTVDEIVQDLQSRFGLILRCRLKTTSPRIHDWMILTRESSELPEHKLSTSDFPVHAFIHFATPGAADALLKMAEKNRLVFRGISLKAKAVDPSRIPNMKSILRLHDVSLRIGVMVSSKEFLVNWDPNIKATFEIDLQRRKIRMLFRHDAAFCTRSSPDGEAWTHCEFKLEFLARDLKHVLETKCGRSEASSLSFLIDLHRPPWIWYRISDGTVYDVSENATVADDDDPWIRTVDFTLNRCLGRCLAYHIRVSPSKRTVFRRVVDQLGQFISCRSSHRCSPLDLKIEYALKCASNTFQWFFTIQCNREVPFEIEFLLNALVHRGILLPTSMGDDFYKLLHPNVTPLSRSVPALKHMFKCNNPVVDAYKMLQEVLGTFFANVDVEEQKADEDNMLIHRIIITPTKAYCLPPEIEVSNRVVRHFHWCGDRFLRVTFLDENMQQLDTAMSVPFSSFVRENKNSNDKKWNVRSAIYSRILSLLNTGFELCGRKYVFLAFSANQLKDHSAWFFAGVGHVGVSHIQKWMGTFPSRNVAKYAARMGQCFSATIKTVKVQEEQICHLPDIEHSGYIFSDGIGKVSPDLALEVSRILKLKSEPSAYQIRYAGYKGVVARWSIDENSNSKLGLRPSMKKFSSDHTDLEVISWTKYIPSFLNRQIIILLSTLGIHDHVFLNLQMEMVKCLNGIFSDKELALEFLALSCQGGTEHMAVTMLSAGFDPLCEPHLRNLLIAIRAGQLQELTYKARIFLPSGRCLLGCLDEASLLAYGQCFIRVSRPDIHSSDVPLCVITGKVVMAKNPCLHPGDVRILEAVDVPELYHMIDCLVLPQLGPRPHQDEASGSDLDGDVYFVCWDKDFLPDGESSEPMDYRKRDAKDLPRDVRTQDMTKFFTQYMVMDKLGKICNAHVVHADLSPIGAFDGKCKHLAELAAMAVDASKTGEHVVMPYDLRPSRYPDFMEKDERETYRSEKILGKLFREAKEVRYDEFQPLRPTFAGECFDPHLEVPGFERFLDEAWQIKCLYEAKLRNIMGLFGIETEGELASGYINLDKKQNSRKQNEIRERVRHSYAMLQGDFRSIFEDMEKNVESTSPGKDSDKENLIEELRMYNLCIRERISDQHLQRLEIWEAKASAWYRVTYHESWLQKYSQVEAHAHLPILYSFPWIAADVLSAIKRRRSSF